MATISQPVMATISQPRRINNYREYISMVLFVVLEDKNGQINYATDKPFTEAIDADSFIKEKRDADEQCGRLFMRVIQL